MIGSGIDCVVTHHLETYASGVARFNEILAEQLGVPFLDLFDQRLDSMAAPLLSFKASELRAVDAERLTALLEGRIWNPQLFLHSWDASELEREMLRRAVRVWAGNLEIRAEIVGLHTDVRDVWTPGLLLDQRTIAPAEIKVFSFGMAHKIQTEPFRRLRELLEATGRSYALLVSSANHATSSISEAQAVYEEMSELFPSCLYFLGNLSDLAVFNELRRATYFASFFPRGVRANNTSVAAAMEHGAVVITNLDDHSPRHMRHMETVIDVNQTVELPQDQLTMLRLRSAAMECGRAHGWERLALMMRAADETGDPTSMPPNLVR